MADTTDRSKLRETVHADNDKMMISDACNIDSSDDPIYVKTERGCSGPTDHSGNVQGFELSVTSSAGSSNFDMSGVTSTDLNKSLVTLTDNKWTAPATGLLLDLYKQNEVRFNNPHIKKKLLWREISEKLNSEGFMFDADKCERKFLNLKTTYRYTVDHNVQTGNQKRCAFYEQLDSIFRFTRDSVFTGRSNQGDQCMDDALNRRVVPVSLTVCDRAGNRPENMPVVPRSDAGGENTSIGPNVNFISGTNTLVVSMDKNSSSSKNSSSHRTTPQAGSRNPVPDMFVDVDNMHHTANRNPLYQSPQQTIFGHVHGTQQQNVPVPRKSNLNFSGDRRMSTHSHERYVPRHTEEEDSSRELPSSSCTDRNDESEFSGQQRGRKRKNSELDNLLATFEKYREEQRQREEQRMKCMKEWHDEEMKVMNRFLDIIQQSMQSGSNN